MLKAKAPAIFEMDSFFTVPELRHAIGAKSILEMLLVAGRAFCGPSE
jgi:hypothetical protein